MGKRDGKPPASSANPPPAGEEAPPGPSEDQTAATEGQVVEAETIEQAPEEAEPVEEVAPEKISKADIEKALGMKLPTEPVEAALQLATALIETRKERDEEVDNWKRIAAEFDNSRKRSERESRERLERERRRHMELASERVMEGLLPVLDALDSAMAQVSEALNTPAEQNMHEGMDGIRYLLLEVAEREGLVPVEAAPGTPFDPAVHEAVQAEENAGGETAGASQVVRAESRRGYRYRSGRVLRPAEVEVGFDPPAAPEDPEPSGEAEKAAQPDAADVGDGPVKPPDDSVSGEMADGGGPAEDEGAAQPDAADVGDGPVASAGDSVSEEAAEDGGPVEGDTQVVKD